MTINISRLSNDELIANTKKAAANERHVVAVLAGRGSSDRLGA